LVPLHDPWYQVQATHDLHEQIEARFTQEETVEADQATHVLHEQIDARLTQGETVEADQAHFAAAISGVAGAAV